MRIRPREQELVLDPPQTFALGIHYRDDKGEYQLQDEGEFKNVTPPSDQGMGLALLLWLRTQ
jgi:hypothetical protein